MTNMTGLIVSRAEAATFHQPWLKEKSSLYTAETRDQLEEALNVPAVAYLMAQRHREEFRRRMLELFARVDVLALPTSLVLAPAVSEADRFLLVLSRKLYPVELHRLPCRLRPLRPLRRWPPYRFAARGGAVSRREPDRGSLSSRSARTLPTSFTAAIRLDSDRPMPPVRSVRRAIHAPRFRCSLSRQSGEFRAAGYRRSSAA